MDIDTYLLEQAKTEEEQIAEIEKYRILYKEMESLPGEFQSVSLVDLNMMSGSSELLRTAIGGYFKNTPRNIGGSESGQFGTRLTTPPAFIPMDPRAGMNINPYIYSVTSYANEKINENLRLIEGETGQASLETGAEYDDFNETVALDVDMQRSTGMSTRYQNTILPSTKFVVHIEGDPYVQRDYGYGADARARTTSDTVLTDLAKGNKFWNALWTGGEFADQQFNPIYTNSVFDDHFIVFPIHYRKTQIKAFFPDKEKADTYIATQGVTDSYLETTFDYNKHLKTYQNFADSIEDIRLLPNYYAMHTVKKYYDPLVSGPPESPDFDSAADLYLDGGATYAAMMDTYEKSLKYKVDQNVLDYYTFAGVMTPETFASFFDDLGSPVYPSGYEFDDGTIYESHDPMPFEGYLDTLMPKFYSEIKQSTKDYMSSTQKNIFFNHQARRFTKGSLSEAADTDDDYLASVSNQRRLLPFYATIAFTSLQSVLANQSSMLDRGGIYDVDTGTGILGWSPGAGGSSAPPETDKKGARESLEKYNCTTMLLRALKECFLNQPGEKSTITPTNKQFVVNQSMLERNTATYSGAGVYSLIPGAMGELTSDASGVSDDALEDYAETGKQQPFIPRTFSNVSNFRTVDFVELMIHNVLNYKNIHDDFTSIYGDTFEARAAIDKKGVYRAYNTKNTLNALNEIVTQMPTGTDNGESAHAVNDFYMLYNSSVSHANDAGMFTQEDLRLQTARSKQYEVIAYRIEKIGGSGTGDGSTREVLQNFWFWNSVGDLDGVPTSEWPFRFIDSQVKYGENYTYKIYAYYLVSGLKYETSNFQLSRIIGPVYDRTFDPTGDGKRYDYDEQKVLAYCIEMYNPETGETTPDLLELAAYGPQAGAIASPYGATRAEDGLGLLDLNFSSLLSGLDISSYATDGQRIAISRASTYETPVGEEAGGYTIAPPYMANFMVTAQPSLKIIEIPIENKTFKISDHPPNLINAVPGYARDNSNKIMFELQYEVFNPRKYPITITNKDAIDRVSYVSGKDVTFFNDVKEETISRLDFVEVYRLENMPRYFSDFKDNLIDTVDFKIKDSKSSYTTCMYSDIIKSNTKYYYLFRAVNENSVSGYINNILQVELVNDGGYKYPIFKTLYDTDIEEMREEDTAGKTVKEVKNLIELVPAHSQTLIDDSRVSYEKTVKNQFENVVIGQSEEGSIWGKTFKLRLTSKKTGKKIDLNITYNDPVGNLIDLPTED